MPNPEELLDLLAKADAPEKPVTRKKTVKTERPKASDVLLTATEQAQEAAKLAQLAADRTLALGKEQKEGLIEISEALGSWRHASRSALKEIKTARNRMGILLGLTAFLAVSSLGGGVWILWQLKKQGESVKADVLDLLQTQMTLNNQKLQLKIDELASVVEALQHDLKRFAEHAPTAATPATMTQVRILPAPDTADTPQTHGAEAPTQHGKVTLPTSSHHAGPETETPVQVRAHHGEESAPTAHATEHVPQPAHAQTAPTVDLSAITTQLNTLKAQLAQLLARQQQLPVHAPPTGQQTDPKLAAEVANIRRLVEAQNAQLKLIRAALWKLRQQTTGASAKPHKQTVSGELHSLRKAIEQLTRQIRALQQQQEKMRAEINALKKETAKLSLERPYSYKAPPLNLE